MDKNPKKSKAFIITFVAVILLLVIGYLIFANKDQIFGTKGSSAISKIFAPLLGTSKQKALDTINSGTTGTGNEQAPAGTGVNGGAGGSTTTGTTPTGSSKGVAYVPPFNPLPGPNGNGGGGNGNGEPVDCKDASGKVVPCDPGDNPTFCTDVDGNIVPCPRNPQDGPAPQCSDGIDNNANGLIDTLDPACHIDFDATNILSYDPKINDESRKQNIVVGPTPTSKCAEAEDDPLSNYFTAADKALLADLLRQFYRIAPELKTEDDVVAEYSSGKGYQALIDQVVELTNQCIDYKAKPTYTGPQAVEDNPYYNDLRTVQKKDFSTNANYENTLKVFLSRYTLMSNMCASGSYGSKCKDALDAIQSGNYTAATNDFTSGQGLYNKCHDGGKSATYSDKKREDMITLACWAINDINGISYLGKGDLYNQFWTMLEKMTPSTGFTGVGTYLPGQISTWLDNRIKFELDPANQQQTFGQGVDVHSVLHDLVPDFSQFETQFNIW